MASLMDDLIQVLESENEEYRKLVRLSEEKKQVIIKAEVPALEKIVDMEQDVSSNIRNLDNRRRKVMDDMATVLNRPREGFTLTAIIGILESQPQEQRRLQNVKEQLAATIDQVQKINGQNQILLKQALDMVEFDLTLFRSMRTAPETANYDRNAYNTGDILGSSGFDAKQ